MKCTIENSYIEFDADMLQDGELCVDMLFVAKNERGQKRGYQLLDMAIEYAKENGYETVGLYAYPQENDAEAISADALCEYYREYGFESDAECPEMMTFTI